MNKPIKLLLLLILLASGCQMHIESGTDMPEDRAKLKEYIASQEAYVEGLQEELQVAKDSLDKLAAANDAAEGYWQKSETGPRLSRQTADVRFIAMRLSSAKSQLAKAKARLEELESQGEKE